MNLFICIECEICFEDDEQDEIAPCPYCGIDCEVVDIAVLLEEED